MSAAVSTLPPLPSEINAAVNGAALHAEPTIGQEMMGGMAEAIEKARVKKAAKAKPQDAAAPAQNAAPTAAASLNDARRRASIANRERAKSKDKDKGARLSINFGMVAHLAPTHRGAEHLSSVFALDAVDYEATRAQANAALAMLSDATGGLNPTNYDESRSLQIFLQSVVSAIVTRAFGSASRYDNQLATIRDLEMPSQNDDRDEDRAGVSGFASKLERAKENGAGFALEAYALMATAHGAMDAYEHITGIEWKAYEANSTRGSVSDQAVAARSAAFEVV